MRTEFHFTRYQFSRIYALVQSSCASVSMVSSICILCMIYRSHQRLSITFNRLIFGLCIADLISSLALSLSTLPLPPDPISPIWNTRGTVATCDMIGFMTFLGTSAAPLYNCSLCIYYVSVIKYNLSDELINKKIEPWFHLLSISLPLLGGFTILFLDAFNPMLTVCWISPYPWGCDMNNDQPCIRGEKWLIPFIIFSILPVIVLPFVICISMCLMYSSVREYEKMMQQYSNGWRRGSTANTINTPEEVSTRTNPRKHDENDEHEGEGRNLSNGGGDRDATQDNEPGVVASPRQGERRNPFIGQIKQWRRSSIARNSESDPFERFNNNRNRESRTILYKAISYSSAYFATYMFYIIVYIYAFVGVEPGFVLEIIFRIFTPLQGFWNFIIFISPRVNSAMISNNRNITWCKAFFLALVSRGPPLSAQVHRRRPTLSSRSSLRNTLDRSSLHLPHTV